MGNLIHFRPAARESQTERKAEAFNVDDMRFTGSNFEEAVRWVVGFIAISAASWVLRRAFDKLYAKFRARKTKRAEMDRQKQAALVRKLTGDSAARIEAQLEEISVTLRGLGLATMGLLSWMHALIIASTTSNPWMFVLVTILAIAGWLASYHSLTLVDRGFWLRDALRESAPTEEDPKNG